MVQADRPQDKAPDRLISFMYSNDSEGLRVAVQSTGKTEPEAAYGHDVLRR
jgi:hypothetical protein